MVARGSVSEANQSTFAKPAQTIVLADSQDIRDPAKPNEIYGSYLIHPTSTDPVTNLPITDPALLLQFPGAVFGWPDAPTTGFANETKVRRSVHYRHSKFANFMFMDGHAKAMRKEEAEKTALTEDGNTLTNPSQNINISHGSNPFVYWNYF
jgi:prepilin-type processing-associated H-X9-DG protein